MPWGPYAWAVGGGGGGGCERGRERGVGGGDGGESVRGCKRIRRRLEEHKGRGH